MYETLVPHVDLTLLFRQATVALAGRVSDTLAVLGLTNREYAVLWRASDSPRTQLEVAELAGLDKTTMVVTLDALESAGFARRQVSPTDRRARIVMVTPAGYEVLQRAQACVASVYTDVLGELGPEEAETLVHALRQLIEGPLSRSRPVGSGVR